MLLSITYAMAERQSSLSGKIWKQGNLKNPNFATLSRIEKKFGTTV